MRDSIFVLLFLVCRIIFIKNVCYSDQFGGLISLPSMFAFCESFQRLQCLQSFYIFKDFNVFSLLHLQDFNVSSLLHLQDFNVFSLLHLPRLQYL